MNQRYEGFLLIELLVAMAIMGILAVVIAQYQSGALLIQQNAHRHMQAIALAGEKLDKVLAGKRLPATTCEQQDNFTVTCHTQEVPIHQLNLPIQLHVQKLSFYIVTVSVQWHDTKQAKHTVSLDAGMEVV